MKDHAVDLCVIGAGSAGLSVAAGAVQLGLSVVLFEAGDELLPVLGLEGGIQIRDEKLLGIHPGRESDAEADEAEQRGEEQLGSIDRVGEHDGLLKTTIGLTVAPG